ncbi:hypothetical protein HH310_26835 [Actinoplanes sp. TBRC 11911]|uniref:hypothetical protein n=1 Tax=Actinoplanes sp. TBRC 11911 TaxID=2729386 RepID=UPI00145C6E75|nr:hypothetical protein [Actinoplanes sp. TBRC 11911]NMO54791.1 hypothetical protein [Actinoplanes sp. TBRC 11911]
MATVIEVRDREALAAEFRDNADEPRIEDADSRLTAARPAAQVMTAEPGKSGDTFGASW